MNRVKLSIIILNYNSSADCQKCVATLKRQRGVKLEIIIVDNCSREDDRSALKRLCEELNCTFIPADANRGYNAGNNIGLRYAASKGYEYALIANPDMEFPDDEYVSRLAKELIEHPETIAVGSDIITPEGVHQNPMGAEGAWTAQFRWITDIFRRSKQKDAYNFVDDFMTNHRCAKLSGCALMVNLCHLAQIGFFDEYPFLYCEEAIFAKQAEKAGLDMRYIADVQAIHRHIPSTKGDPRPRFRHWRRSRLYFIRHYSGYPWHGRLLASLSWSSYLNLLILLSTIKRRL